MRELKAAITRLASGRLCSPTPAQYAVRPALEGDKSFLEDFIRDIRQRRDFAVARVREIGLSCAEPEAAFYLMVRADGFATKTDEDFVLELLEATGVLVVPGSGFGAGPSEGYFRLVYLPNEPTLRMVFDRMHSFIATREAGAETT
jgi:aspartate/methionine/tyrosine aminotransferase